VVAGSIRLVSRHDHGAGTAPTLVPIAVGYTVAHYASLLLVEGRRGALLLVGVTDAPALTPAPGAIAVVQIVAVLAGHACGVLAAHDRVLAGTAPATPGARIADELPLVLLMVGYTMIGLALLFAT
jgi:hypothetical protein